MPSVCSPNLSLPFSPLREMGYPFSAPKLILLQRLCRQLSVTTSISSPTSKRELSPNGLISCGQSGVERGRCNPVRKTTKILYASVAPPSLHLFPLSPSLSVWVRQSVRGASVQSASPRESYRIGTAADFRAIRGAGAKNHPLHFFGSESTDGWEHKVHKP